MVLFNFYRLLDILRIFSDLTMNLRNTWIRLLTGLIAYLKYNIDLSIAVPCAMAAVPCTLVPAPMTFVFLAATLFGLDGIGST